MKPATLEESAPATPELIKFEFNEHGVACEPEEVKVPMPKGSKCIISLAQLADGLWVAGWAFETPKNRGSVTTPCANNSEALSRVIAIRVALGAAVSFFQHDKKAVKAIESFFDKTMEGSPANTSERNQAKPLPPLPASVYVQLPVDKIEPNPENARAEFDAIEMKELANSIEEVGLLSPIAVRRLLSDELDELPGVSASVKAERFEIIAGERRHRAHVMLKRETISCMLYEGVTRAQAKAAALVENLQRVGLNAIEEAIGYKDLMQSQGLTQEQCAERVGKSRPVVANALRVLELPEKVIKLLRDGKLTTAHGVALARFRAFPKGVTVMAEETLNQGATASMLEKGVPFIDDLEDAEVICSCYSHEVGGEYPALMKKHPAYFKQGGAWICFEPAHWQGLVKEHKAEQAEKAKAARERELRKAQKKRGMKCLADLPRAAYVEVRQKDPILAALLPCDAVEDAKQQWGDGKVEICTKPALYKKIDEAVAVLRNADRKEKLSPLVEKARKKILGTKKLGPRELALLMLIASVEGGHVTSEAAKRQGVKWSAKLIGWGVGITSECLTAVADIDPVDYFRVIVDSILESYLDDDGDEVGGFDPKSETATLVKYLLELDDFGLLEETKAGQKQLVDTVKNSDWYIKEMAALEAEDQAEGKAGK